MMHRIRKHTISFKHAFDGMVWAFRSQPNYIVHAIFSILSIAGSIFFQISYGEFLIIILLITLGFTVETINSAIEKVCDAITTDYNEEIKIAKDAAAAAMLIYVVGAVTLACIIFLPRIILLLGYN